MIRLVAVLALLLASPVTGQTVQGDNSTIKLDLTKPDITRKTKVRATSAPAAVLRGLDKISGASVDLQLTTLEPVTYGALTITMQDCRYPANNPSGDAYALVTIIDKGIDKPVFEGWMVASSPALSALDHPRYDVWIIRCKLDNRSPAVIAGESSPRPIMRPEGLGDSSNG